MDCFTRVSYDPPRSRRSWFNAGIESGIDTPAATWLTNWQTWIDGLCAEIIWKCTFFCRNWTRIIFSYYLRQRKQIARLLRIRKITNILPFLVFSWFLVWINEEDILRVRYELRAFIIERFFSVAVDLRCLVRSWCNNKVYSING